MSSARLLRLSGLAAIVGAALSVVAQFVGLAMDTGGIVESVSAPAFFVAQGLWLSSAILALAGLVGLYAGQAGHAGSLGLAGFAGAFTGGSLMTGVFWQRLFDVPWIATQAPALLEAQPMGGGVLAFGLRLSIIVMAAGWMLFGISSFRAGVYPRIPAVLLIIGAPLLIPGVPGAALPFTVAVVWLGYALFTRQGTAVSVDSAAAPRMVPAS